MFKVVKTLTTWWPVKVYEPDPVNPGKFAQHEFEIEFEILDRDAVRKNIEAREAILVELEAAKTDAEARAARMKIDDQFEKELQRVVRNWRGIIDDSDNVFLFNNENMAFLLNRSTTRDAINAAYGEAIDSGKARAGN